MNRITKTLLTLALVLGGMVAFAQSAPVNITNNTGCHYLVRAVAVEPGCTNPCATATICVPPGAVVSLNPCGMPHLIWCNVQVTPADANCQACPSPFGTVNVSAPNDPCAPYPQHASGKHCDALCGSFNVDYLTPNDVHINP